MIDCMIDLETWGLPPDGLIISIGAVKFDLTHTEGDSPIMDRFHVCIDPVTPSAAGFKIEPSTIRWWLHPDRDEARVVWHDALKVDLATALEAFGMWYGGDPVSKPQAVWSNGVTFDVTMLKHAYKTLHMNEPWQFYEERCHRTLKTIVPEVVANEAFKTGCDKAHSGVLHSALFDAEVQAHQNMLLRRYLGLVPS